LGFDYAISARHRIPDTNTSKLRWLAVDLFFAISGFVICLVVTRSTFSPLSFLTKRFFRLYPLYIVMLVAFAITAWLWRGFTPRETPEFFLYSMTLLPTHGFPFYDIGWTLQHEAFFYLVAALVIPFAGIYGLITFLLASTLAFHTIDLPWYLSDLASHHGEFLAGVTAFLMRGPLARLGFLLPAIIGVAGLAFFAADLKSSFYPIPLFFLIVAFSNIVPKVDAWWQRPVIALGDASYSIYLIHPMVFLAASSLVSKLPSAALWVQEPVRYSCISISIAIALLSWRYFETPMIQLGNKIADIKLRSELARVAT
jgi:exopolysaccharide production protein ExoZ